MTTPEILSEMDLVQHERDESHIKLDNCECHRLADIKKVTKK